MTFKVSEIDATPSVKQYVEKEIEKAYECGDADKAAKLKEINDQLKPAQDPNKIYWKG